VLRNIYFLTARRSWEYYWSLISASDIIHAKLTQNERLLTNFLCLSTNTSILGLIDVLIITSYYVTLGFFFQIKWLLFVRMRRIT